MRIFRTTKQYFAGFQEGSKAGYELALQRVEALIHVEMKKVARSKVSVKEVRLGELYCVLQRIKELQNVKKS